MPTEIIKPERDVDFYVAWSSIVEAPTMFGPRDWMLQHIEGSANRGHSRADRLARADETGTSAIGGWGCDYDCTGLIYQQEGLLARELLPVLCARLAVDERADVSDLLRPFADRPVAASFTEKPGEPE